MKPEPRNSVRGDRRRCLVQAGRADKGKHDGELTEERSVQGAPSRAPTLREQRPVTATARLSSFPLARSLGRRLQVFKGSRAPYALLLIELPSLSRSSSV